MEENHIRPIVKMVPPALASYNATTHLMTFHNGSTIKFGHWSGDASEDEYNGLEYDWIFIDEATQFSERSFNFLGGCLRGVNQFPKRMYLTCNPGGVGHRWVKRLFIDRQFKQMYLDEVIEISTRTDEYGGPFENRVRLLAELIREIKEACGSSFLVAVRFGNPDYEELIHTASVIETAGADLLDVSTGSERYRDIPSDFLYDGKVYAASLVRKQAQIPVICVGNIFDGQTGEGILSAGYADMIAVGRGHLCDPAWAHKAMAGAAPNGCLRCRHCMWYVDGRKCPAVKRREKRL